MVAEEVSQLGRLTNPMRSTATAFVAPRKRDISHVEFSSELKFQEGDEVVTQEASGQSRRGVIHQKRGSGWYAVRHDDGTIKKFRRSQLVFLPPPMNETGRPYPKVATAGTAGATGVSISPICENISATKECSKLADIPVPSPPTIHNLDALMNSTTADEVLNKSDRSLLEQCHHHASFNKWVVFSDLHCQTSSLQTCLEVLGRVHDEAKVRGAGILFLGDFWHHRGSIRVELLNSVLEGLSHYEVPMIMIPGNHDQVTLGGCTHGLTPLQHAYRVDLADGRTVPGPLIFSYPTKFLDALFVPHIRQNAIMESILWSQESRDSKALFVHSDVVGAKMNDLVVSTSGVSPNVFPQRKPVYSGHFHLMHNVTTVLQQTIQYIGSPYQTSLSEAEQKKALWVLDASNGWKCDEIIPLSIGRRYFKATWGDTDIESKDIGPSDRVVLSISKAALETMRLEAPNGSRNPFDTYVQELRLAGASVEVKEIVPTIDQTKQTQEPFEAEELEPSNVFRLYLEYEVERGKIAEKTAEILLNTGIEVLGEVSAQDELPSLEGVRQSNELVLTDVTIEGFGPFRAKASYPLSNRGLVLLCGSSQGSGSDSNGSGKSTLAMASQWALTNTIDARPVDDARIFDIINNESKSAKVAVRGVLNGEPFVVSRSRSKSKSSLSFYLGGDDLTTQTQRETQELINMKLGITPCILSRSIFHGQHFMNGLLEATDGRLKDELSLVVPLRLWQECVTLVRGRGRIASKRITELETILRLRTEDLEELQGRCKTLDSETEQMQLEIESHKVALEMLKPEEKQCSKTNRRELLRAVKDAATELSSAESTIQAAEQRRSADIKHVQELLGARTKVLSEANERLQEMLRERASAEAKAESAELILNSTIKRLRLHDASEQGARLEVCPLCSQPITGESSVFNKIDSEIEAAQERAKETKAALGCLETEVSRMKAHAVPLHASLESTQEEMATMNGKWARIIERKKNELQTARSAHARAVQDLSTDVSISATSKHQELANIVMIKQDSLNAKREMQASNTLAMRDLQKSLEEMKKELDTEKDVAAQMVLLATAFGPKGIQTFILRNTIGRLKEFTQGYLDHLSDGSQRLTLSFEDGDKIIRRALIRRQDGTYSERPLSSLSGGQWRRCALALSLGFADLMAARGRIRPSLIVLDEPLTHLDRTGRLLVASLLRKMLGNGSGVRNADGLHQQRIAPSTIILILQDVASFDLEGEFHVIDEVVREGGTSRVVVDGN